MHFFINNILERGIVLNVQQTTAEILASSLAG